MNGFRSKIKSPTALKKVLSKSHAPIVFTNGCFDLIHKGHVDYLERAKKLGKTLIVALNSDSSVKMIKGPERPLNPLSDRMEVMAALESVDYVTWFEEDNPVQLICLLRPQILVKGGDWKASQILGGEEVRSWGGRVKSLKFVPGRSTTQIINKMRKN